MSKRNKKKHAPITELEITGISSDGKAVGKKDGLVVFVQGGAPGDIVDVEITGKEKKFLIGRPTLFHQRSSDRQEPFCEYFGVCGGCKWQHITYEAQKRHKASHINDNLRKLSGMDLPNPAPILGSEETTYYRNKLEFTFSNNRWFTKDEIATGETISRNAVGFHIPRMYDKIVNVQHCHLQADPSNKIRNVLNAFAESEELSYYDIRNHQGLLRNLIIRITTTGETMVIVQFGEDNPEAIEKVMQFLHKEFPDLTALLYIVNTKQNETFYDLPVHLVSGQPHIHEKMGDLTFRIGPKSFFQTNSHQAKLLYDKVVELANLSSNEVVYDLYGGTGTIANYVAGKAKMVIGIESVPEAVADAKINAEINGITNAEFYVGDMKDLLSKEFVAGKGKPDIIITDPPRAGMHKNVVAVLNKLKVPRIVYVSCNPATQARDLQLLGEVYEVEQIQPVDMFPQTHHVENIALLKLKD